MGRTTMSYIEILGWLGAFFTLSAYSMTTMLPLRLSAIVANIFFISYGALASVHPMLFLHLVLFPLNAYRLYQITLTTQKIKAARSGTIDVELLRPLLKPERLSDGSYVFRKGDSPDFLYFIENGAVHLDEIDVTLNAGDLLGEIAFFTNAKERTVSARCVGDCTIMKLDEAGFMRLYYQNPAFGFSMIKLVANRLLEGVQAKPEAYKSGAEARRSRSAID